MYLIRPDRYSIDYSRPAPALASGNGNFLAVSSLERARRNLAREAQQTPPPKKAAAPPPAPKPEPPQEPPRRQPSAKKPARPKRPPAILATLSGLLLSGIILLAATGLYGAYCFSRGLPGDVNVYASTIMYCLAVFAGCFWAGAMVKRKTLVPAGIICATYLVISVVVSLQLFSLAEFKFTMLLFKVLITAVAGLAGFVLSVIPYLINQALKRSRQQERERRLRRRAQY